MNSGDKTKPPAIEERNPFDISRHSGTDVAAEIAKRMAVWKQARSRKSVTPATSPSEAAKPSSTAAPVQSARAPKPAAPEPAPQSAQATTPAARSAARDEARVPYFALSAVRRAMPPAPSLKQGSGRTQQAPTRDEPASSFDESAIPIAAPALDQTSHQTSPRHDALRVEASDAPSTVQPETPLADLPPIAGASIEDSPLKAAGPRPSDPVASPSIDEASDPIPPETDDNEHRRAEAHAIKARWLAARDLDAMIDTSGAGRNAASAVEAAMATAQETASGKPGLAHEPQDVAASRDGLPGVKPADVASRNEQSLDEPAESEHDPALVAAADEEPAPEIVSEIGTAPRAVATDVPDQAIDRPEPTFDARMARVTPALLAGRDVAWETPPLGLAALDEMAGRREPTFDSPMIATEEEVAEEPRVPPAAGAAPEPAAFAPRDTADEGLSIAALDEVAGRREPTFDHPVQPAPLEIEPAAAARNSASQERNLETSMVSRSDAPTARGASETGSATSAGHQVLSHSPDLSIAALDEAVGRKEPTFDEPVRPATAAAAAAAKAAAPHVALRPIETRIEARRFDALRADPRLAGRHPVPPQIEPEEWDVPPPIAAPTHRARRGAGWAIGLGSVLLIAGITAPAAIWQQGRQAVLDQIALVNPKPAAQRSSPSTQSTPSTSVTPAQPPAQATSSAAPRPEAAPAADTPESAATGIMATPPVEQEAEQTASNAQPAAEPEAGQPASNAEPATTLGTVSDGGDVNEAPVVAPPPPMVNLASKSAAAGTTPMVARPFVPEQGDGPFLRAPTTGAASVAVGTPQPGAQPVETGVKPRLMGQLKPKATAVASASKPVGKPRAVARKPKPFFQQSPDQMFETLIETLSEGRPINPATKPVAPSNRR